MRSILDKTTQRTIHIIEALSETTTWLTLKDLSILTDSSERTVAQDISMIKKRWGNYLNIETSNKNGIRVHEPNIAKTGKTIIDLLNESVGLLFLEAILLYPRNKIEFYEQKLFVSRSTLLRLLPKINQFLSEKELWIQNQENQYELKGTNEQYLRQFFACFLIELHGLTLKDELKDLKINIIGETIGNILSLNIPSKDKEYILEDNISISYLIMLYIVSLIRENEGYCINSNHKLGSELSPEAYSYFKSYFPNMTMDKFAPIHEYIINIYMGWDSKDEEEKVLSAIDSFCKRIFNSLQSTPSKQVMDRLFFTLKSLYLVAKSRPYETSVLFDRIKYFSLSFKKNNETMYQFVKKNLEIFSNEVNYDMSKRLHDFLFWMCLNYPEFSKTSGSKCVLVISDFGKQHTDYLKQFFDSYFNTKGSTILTMTSSDYMSALTTSLQPYHFIISTIPDLPIEHKHIILVNDYPSTENLFEIHKMLFTN